MAHKQPDPSVIELLPELVSVGIGKLHVVQHFWVVILWLSIRVLDNLRLQPAFRLQTSRVD